MKNAISVLSVRVLGIIAVVAVTGTILAGCASMTVISVDSVDGPKQIGQYKDLDPKSITVNATYKDGSKKKVNVYPTDITFDNTKVGPQKVSINVGFNKTASFQTEVLAFQSLSGPDPSENRNVRQNYGIEQSLVKLYGTWDKLGKMEFPFYAPEVSGHNMDPDARHYSVYGVDDLTGFDPYKIGTQTITVAYKGLKTSFDITVVPMTAIKIVKLPLKLVYKIGEDINDLYLVPMEVEGVWEGLPNKKLPVKASNISNYDKNKEGKQTLRYTVEGKSATFEITVTK